MRASGQGGGAAESCGVATRGRRRAQESRRIDNQLRGRSGRQGDPGSTRYFLSLEDTRAPLPSPRMRCLGGSARALARRRTQGRRGLFLHVPTACASPLNREVQPSGTREPAEAGMCGRRCCLRHHGGGSLQGNPRGARVPPPQAPVSQPGPRGQGARGLCVHAAAGGLTGGPGAARARSLFRVFGGERIQGLMSLLQIEDLPMENKMLSDSLNDAQRKVESYFFGARTGEAALGLDAGSSCCARAAVVAPLARARSEARAPRSACCAAVAACGLLPAWEHRGRGCSSCRPHTGSSACRSPPGTCVHKPIPSDLPLPRRHPAAAVGVRRGAQLAARQGVCGAPPRAARARPGAAHARVRAAHRGRHPGGAAGLAAGS